MKIPGPPLAGRWVKMFHPLGQVARKSVFQHEILLQVGRRLLQAHLVVPVAQLRHRRVFTGHGHGFDGHRALQLQLEAERAAHALVAFPGRAGRAAVLQRIQVTADRFVHGQRLVVDEAHGRLGRRRDVGDGKAEVLVPVLCSESGLVSRRLLGLVDALGFFARNDLAVQGAILELDLHLAQRRVRWHRELVDGVHRRGGRVLEHLRDLCSREAVSQHHLHVVLHDLGVGSRVGVLQRARRARFGAQAHERQGRHRDRQYELFPLHFQPPYNWLNQSLQGVCRCRLRRFRRSAVAECRVSATGGPTRRQVRRQRDTARDDFAPDQQKIGLSPPA